MSSHSLTGMRRSENTIPPIVTSRTTEYVSLVDQLGRMYSVMSNSEYMYLNGDKFLVGARPVILRNGLFWFPGTTTLDIITLSVEAVFVNVTDVLQYESDLGLTIEDDMELPIPSNIISVVILQVLSNNYSLITPRQQLQQQQAMYQQQAVPK